MSRKPTVEQTAVWAQAAAQVKQRQQAEDKAWRRFKQAKKRVDKAHEAIGQRRGEVEDADAECRRLKQAAERAEAVYCDYAEALCSADPTLGRLQEELQAAQRAERQAQRECNAIALDDDPDED
jgi:hypothetical protein